MVYGDSEIILSPFLTSALPVVELSASRPSHNISSLHNAQDTE
jgi:hypothetical protein